MVMLAMMLRNGSWTNFEVDVFVKFDEFNEKLPVHSK